MLEVPASLSIRTVAEPVQPTELLLEVRGVFGPVRATSATFRHDLGTPPTVSIRFRLAVDTFDPQAAVGKPAQVESTTSEGSKQLFIGEVQSVNVLDWGDNGWEASAEVVGGSIAASLNRHARTFCDKSAPEIIQAVLSTHAGFAVKLDRLKASYVKRPYTVQYFESDLNFVARLAHDSGFAILFESDAFPMKAWLVDDAFDFEKHTDALPYSGRALSQNADLREEIIRMTIGVSVTPGSYVVDAYDFRTPKKKLTAKGEGMSPAESGGDYVSLDTAYLDPSEGKELVQRLASADAAGTTIIAAESNSSELRCGIKFDLTEHPDPTMNRTYYITGSTTDWTAPADTSGSSPTGAGATFLRLQTVPSVAVRDFAPPPKSADVGPILGVVTGADISGNPEKGAIAVDAHGRVRVKFKWHGLSAKASDTDRTAPIRVAQGWAGEKRGFHLLPRVGDEVVVAFEGGDPERPIIIGSLFNEKNAPAGLPDEAAQLVLRSRSLPGGKSENFNELRFDDCCGSERVFLQAERDLEESIKNNVKIDIGNRGEVTAKSGYLIEVGGASLEIKPDSVKLKLGAAQLTFDAAGQVVLNGQIIRIG